MKHVFEMYIKVEREREREREMGRGNTIEIG